MTAEYNDGPARYYLDGETICQDYHVDQAIREIKATYGDIVSVSRKAKSLLKFGANFDLASSGTAETVWAQGGDETYVSANSIDKFSSSSGDDTGTMVVEGHTIDGSGEFTFVTQSVTLQGQTEASLTTPLARSSRLYNTLSGS